MVDILVIHDYIINKFENTIKTDLKILLDDYISLYLDDDDDTNMTIDQKIKKNKITDIMHKFEYSYYLMDTESIIDEYNLLLQSRVKISFINSSQRKINKDKENLENKYIQIAKQYINTKFNEDVCHDQSCKNCNSTDFEIEIASNNTHICMKCGNLLDFIIYNTKYKDNDRVKMVTKYVGDRKVHFKDCLQRFLGRENLTTPIPQELIDDLHIYLEKYNLINKNSTNKYENISREHIYTFIKSHPKYSDYIDHISLVYKHTTKREIYDISNNIEEFIIEDFGTISELYDIKIKNGSNIEDRRNFLNSQYILYQLFKKYNIKCNKNDFIMLKSQSRKLYHDSICEELFKDLSWPFYPIF